MLTKNNISLEQKARYMDDLRAWLYAIRLGWRWVEGELVFSSSWRTEEQELGMTGLQKTVEVVCDMMNDVSGFLKMTMETCTDFDDETLPTLDMRLWIGNDNRTMYSFFEKPMSSNQVIQRKSAMPENMRMSTLNQEMVRRMMNTSELLDIKVRVGVVDDYCQKLCNSGYSKEQTLRVVTGGLTCYEKRVDISKDKDSLKYRPLHESAIGTAGKRMKKKLLGRSNWFRSKKRPLEEEDDHGHEETSGKGSPRKKRKPSVVREDRPEIRRVESDSLVLNDDGAGAVRTGLSNIESARQAESKQREGKTKVAVRKMKQRKQVRQDPPTISVMFVEQTAGGELARRVQEAEDRLAGMTGYRVRMTETSGSKLCHLLPNTNPWSGRHCERIQCYTCNQGGDRLEDCKRRNLLYESSCSKCQGYDDMGKKKRKGRGLTGRAVYVGETARSIFERSKEHWNDAQAGSSDSHMVKHWVSDHAEEKSMPDFKIKVVASFKDALTRQIAESVRIDRRGSGVLNSRTEYSRCRLPRLTIDRSEWELAEMARKEIEDVTIRNEMEVINEDDILGKEGGAIWSMGRSISHTGKRKEPGIEERKRKKRKLDVVVDWGGPLTEQEEGIKKWLEVESDGERSVSYDSGVGIGLDSRFGQRSMEMELVLRNRQKQMSIVKYTQPVHDILTVMVEDWVMVELMEMVWETVVEREEVRLIVNDTEIIAGLVDTMPALVTASNEDVEQESVAEMMVAKKMVKKVIHKRTKKQQFEADRNNKKITEYITVGRKRTAEESRLCPDQDDPDPDVALEGSDLVALAKEARLVKRSRMTDAWRSRRISWCVVMEMVRGMEAQAAARSVINIMMEGVLRKTGTGSQEDAWSTLGSRDGEGHDGQRGVHDGGVQDDVKAVSKGWPGGAGRVPQLQGAGVHGGEGGDGERDDETAYAGAAHTSGWRGDGERGDGERGDGERDDGERASREPGDGEVAGGATSTLGRRGAAQYFASHRSPGSRQKSNVVVTNFQSSGKRRVAKAKRSLNVIEPGMVQNKITQFLEKYPNLKKNSSSPGQKLVFNQIAFENLSSQGPHNNIVGLKRKVYQMESPQNQLKRIRQNSTQDQLTSR